MFKHKTIIEVRWGDMDNYGHVNNTLFFRYFEMARFRYFEDLQVMPQGRLPTAVLANISCQFRRALFYPATISVLSKVVRIGNSSFDMNAEIRCDAALCASSQATLVWVNHDTHKPESIPKELCAKIIDYESIGA